MTLKGIVTDNVTGGWDKIKPFGNFGLDVLGADDDFPSYTFIEPNYGFFWSDFTHGSSQHPLDSVVGGEELIKQVYELLRNSPIWDRSALIITYDEHGGFYDHEVPPAAVPPGDRQDYEDWNESQLARDFRFDRLGVRVPAVIVSPLIERGTVDHTVYDHASVIATVADRFGLDTLTERDKHANKFDHLFSRQDPRSDAIVKLPPAFTG